MLEGLGERAPVRCRLRRLEVALRPEMPAAYPTCPAEQNQDCQERDDEDWPISFYAAHCRTSSH